MNYLYGWSCACLFGSVIKVDAERSVRGRIRHQWIIPWNTDDAFSQNRFLQERGLPQRNSGVLIGIDDTNDDVVEFFDLIFANDGIKMVTADAGVVCQENIGAAGFDG